LFSGVNKPDDSVFKNTIHKAKKGLKKEKPERVQLIKSHLRDSVFVNQRWS